MATRKKAARKPAIKKSPLLISVKALNRQSGVTDIDFSFLRSWLGPAEEAAFVEAIGNHSRRHCAPQPMYSIRSVLKFWQELGHAKTWPAPSPRVCTQTMVSQLSELRGEFYAVRAKKVALSTITNQWTEFVRFLPALVNSRAISFIEDRSSSIAAPSMSLVIADRDTAANSLKAMANAPKTLNTAKNSFNDNLLEPISIIDGSEVYLERYQQQLAGAIETILSCAVRDFESFEQARVKGLSEISCISAKDVAALGSISPAKNSWTVWATLVKEKPTESLRFALGVVTHEMNGIPKGRRKYDATGRNSSPLDGAKGYWDIVAAYGKNELLPYLGIMNSKAASVCMAILIIEHPILNPVSLYRAKVERRRGGGSYITSDGLSGKAGMRLSVEKLRAGLEKSTPLSPLSQRVLARVFEWTEPLRKVLLSEGRLEEANCLWVGMSTLDYRIKAFSEKSFLTALGANEAWRSIGQKSNSTRLQSFASRHSELERWRGRLTYKNLRMSSGVLKVLQADGDIAEAARIFGHRSVNTTLGHYIPNALRIALFERQVRRHQNRLISEAVIDQGSLLRISDFSRVEDLHEFLASMNIGSKEDVDKGGSCVSAVDGSGLILYRDPNALAVAMLYRDHLRTASSQFLDRPDLRTGVTPRFWVDFVDKILEPLPAAMIEVSDLVAAASSQKMILSPQIRLPEVA